MTTNDDLTARMIKTNGEMLREASDRRLAATPIFIMPDTPADRSRNNRRTRRSFSRRTRTIL